MNKVYGYKVFKLDWTCRGFQYEVGKTFEENVTPLCCNRGFHFCKELIDCFNYCSFNPDNKVAKVVALGELDEESDGSKCCTNKIQIVEEISWEDVLRMVNIGKGNTGNRNSGNCNTGNRNSGDWNTGNRNSGNCNTGNRNSGDWNTGNRNTGNHNSGNCNTGNHNSGNCNTGNHNSGDWNNTNFSNGCFNTEEPKICLFNKPSDWTYRDWLNSDARYILNQIPRNVVTWVCSSDMTEEEKKAHPSYETTGGYLKILDVKDCSQTWWDRLSVDDKNIVMSLPNFNAEIFYECTGIRVN